ATITVYPDCLLKLDYFLQRDVIGDDPFTPVIEASEPFNLGLLVKNVGAGSAKNFRIASAKPQVFENQKGLLIDFQMIGTKVGNTAVTPSLSAVLGDIAPGHIGEVQWILNSSLMGRFKDYSASFQHVSDL